MSGKKGIIFGVSNKKGIAYGITKVLHDQGAEIALSYAGEIMESRVKPIAEELGIKLCLSCDVTKDEEVEAVFAEFGKTYGTCDFVVHAVAYALREELTGDFSNISRQGWDIALGISSYSLISMARYAKPLMTNGGSIIALSYIGAEKSVPNYNIMGTAKAALESNVRYLASEFGLNNVRVNAISAGPMKTLAAKGIGGFDVLYKVNQIRSPLKRNITLEEVGNAALFLCSDMSTGITGEVLHVDAGFHSVALVREDALLVGIDPNNGNKE
ncbi:MAG: enoyl-ACP reductase [Candidatus Margulisiibacteriota bacterium]